MTSVESDDVKLSCIYVGYRQTRRCNPG